MLETFAQRLRRLRLAKNLTQTQLGNLVKLHYNHIGRYERGGSRPTLNTLRRLAEVLEVDADYLLNGDITNIAKSKLADEELLRHFQDVEQLPDEDKLVVKKLISAFLLQHQITEMASRRV